MAKGVGINFEADADEVVKESRRVQGELEDVADGLEKVGDSGDDAGQKASSGLGKVEESAKDVATQVDDGAGGAFSNLAGKAGTALDGIDTSLTGLASLAGGVGGIVSNVVGGAVDFVTQQIQTQIEKTEELKTRFADAYQTASEEGRNYLDTAQIVAAASDIFFDPAKMDEFSAKAEAVGVDVQTYVLAQAGSYEDLAVVIEAAKQKEQERVDAIDSARGGEAYVAEVDAIRDIIAENETLIQSHKDGAEAAENAQGIKEHLAENERDQIKRTSEADQARYDALAANYAAAAEKPPIDIKTSLQEPDVTALLDGLQRAVSRRPINVTVNGYTRNGDRIV